MVVGGRSLGVGSGPSRRIAETSAAAEALDTIRRERQAARTARSGTPPVDGDVDQATPIDGTPDAPAGASADAAGALDIPDSAGTAGAADNADVPDATRAGEADPPDRTGAGS